MTKNLLKINKISTSSSTDAKNDRKERKAGDDNKNQHQLPVPEESFEDQKMKMKKRRKMEQKSDKEPAAEQQSAGEKSQNHRIEAIGPISAAGEINNCTRLIVKNLPSSKKTRWNDDTVRAHFAKFGTLTDIRLKLSEKTGAAKFAFVGFADAQSCQVAIKKMDGTFVKGSKLQVEECKPLSAERTAITKQIYAKRIKNMSSKEVEFLLAGGEKEEVDEKECDVDKLIESKILDTGRLYLRNLSFSCTSDDVRALFSPFGTLADVECIVDRAGKCKGFAFCTFMFPEHALAAWKALDGSIFMGRMLHVIAGEEKVRKTDEAESDGQHCRSAFQRDRQTARKQDATRTAHTWNALFLGTDAVAETAAESYELEKRHLLMEEGENSAAVRIAMVEARLVRETRKFLAAHGVRLDAFSKPPPVEDATASAPMKRSKTVILVKNLDAKVGGLEQEGRLSKLFGRFGEVKAVLMPPEHAISALVEMATEPDAKRAFEALAYSKKHSGQPMYLEWSPADVFDEDHPSRAIQRYGYQRKSNVESEEIAAAEEEEGRPTAAGDDGNAKKGDDDELSKLLVRNVPFQANLKEITQLFSAFGELKFIRMPKKPGAGGHRGFCFVDFVSVGDARRAMEALAPSTHLYGRRLVLEWARPDDASVDEMRQRTERRIGTTNNGRTPRGGKRPKMRSF